MKFILILQKMKRDLRNYLNNFLFLGEYLAMFLLKYQVQLMREENLDIVYPMHMVRYLIIKT